jgi:hypothetical protein
MLTLQLRLYITIMLLTLRTICSAQFPELHARMCKTYLDALGPDKTLGTLYGAIVGLSALGNHIVRTLLIPNLNSIEQRIQASERHAASTTTGGGSGATASGAGASLPGKSAGAVVGVSAGDKRKRGGSVDEAGAINIAGAAEGRAKGLSRAAVAKQLQLSYDVSMCKQALLRALGTLQPCNHSLALYSVRSVLS